MPLSAVFWPRATARDHRSRLPARARWYQRRSSCLIQIARPARSRNPVDVLDRQRLLALHLAVEAVQETIDRSGRPRRTHAQFPARQLFEVHPFTGLDAQVLQQVALERDLTFRSDGE